jgi:hypothetical protein
MPLTKLAISPDLISSAGDSVRLNSEKYPEFSSVEGEPSLSAKNPRRDAALREAFVALHVAKKRASQGDRQFVYLGEPAIRFLYGRAKDEAEQDCDVVGRILQREYGYWLAEGKGADVQKALAQFEVAKACIDRNRDAAGPVLGALVATNRLRYLRWIDQRRQWVAFLDNAEETRITARLQENIARAKPTLQREKVYLLDGPEDDRNKLPLWSVNSSEPQPMTVWIHDRTGSDRGQFRPLQVGQGRVQIFYVAS